MTGYRRGHNSVAEVPFQLSQNLPASPPPLMQRLSNVYLRGLVMQQPAASLQDYCERVQQECENQITPQTMCKLLLRLGLSRAGRHQLQRQVAKSQPPT